MVEGLGCRASALGFGASGLEFFIFSLMLWVYAEGCGASGLVCSHSVYPHTLRVFCSRTQQWMLLAVPQCAANCRCKARPIRVDADIQPFCSKEGFSLGYIGLITL